MDQNKPSQLRRTRETNRRLVGAKAREENEVLHARHRNVGFALLLQPIIFFLSLQLHVISRICQFFHTFAEIQFPFRRLTNKVGRVTHMAEVDQGDQHGRDVRVSRSNRVVPFPATG